MTSIRPPFLDQVGPPPPPRRGPTQRQRAPKLSPWGVVGIVVLFAVLLALALALNAVIAWFCLEIVGGVDISLQQAVGVGLLTMLSGASTVSRTKS